MLTVQSYQPINNRNFYKYNSTFKGGSELSETSKLLVQTMKNYIGPQKNSIIRSKRFVDGSFVEIQDVGSKGLTLRYMRINQKPVDIFISSTDKFSTQSKLVNPNNIIEKYIPDIIETMQATM